MVKYCLILSRLINLSDKSSRENQNTYFILSNFSCRLWDRVENEGRATQATDNNIVGLIRFACWITKVTDTHSEYVMFIAFPREKWLHLSALILHVHLRSPSCFEYK
jgi:hypothetical protein